MHGKIYRSFFVVAAMAAAFLHNRAHAETIEEKHDNGQVKVRYESTDGKKDGSYEEFYEDGTLRVSASYRAEQLNGEYVRYYPDNKVEVRATYRRGKKHGGYTERYPDGQPKLTMSYSLGKPRGKHQLHRDGKRHWNYVWKKGELLKINGNNTHIHSLKDLKKGLGKIYKAKVKSRSAPKDHVAALRQLNAYRFICGLPTDVVLDPKQSYHCQAAAELLKAHGELSHTPPKPGGMSEKRYQEGFLGTTRSNLAIGTDLAVSIDHYMYDSDTFNIGNIGHRRWCMNPEMKTTGFGLDDKYCVMWSMDNRRKPAPEYPYLAFPPQGYMPVKYFSQHHAWCVSLSNKQFESDENSRAAIYPLDENLIPGEPLKMAHHSYVGEAGPNRDWGPENMLIFKPESLDLTPGARYAVEITGIRDNNGKEITFHYVVQFVDLEDDGAKSSSR